MFENFKAFLVEELGRIDPDSITMESSLSGDLGINSLELADMIYNCADGSSSANRRSWRNPVWL